MARALSLCLEAVAPTGPSRFLACSALPSGERGLGLDARGEVSWRAERPACTIAIGEDERLSLLRQDAGATVVLTRAGRSLEVGLGEPTVLLPGDELGFEGERRLRIHVHGWTDSAAPPAEVASVFSYPVPPVPVIAHPPAPMPPEPIEVRETPPMIAPDILDRSPPPPPATGGAAPWIALAVVLAAAIVLLILLLR